MRRETPDRPFEPRRMSLRLPLGIAAAMLLALAAVVSLRSKSDELVAQRLVRQQALEAAQTAAVEVERELQRISAGISDGEPRQDPAIKLIGYRSPSSGSTRWWPEAAGTEGPDPLAIPGWFALGGTPPQTATTRVDICYAALQAVVEAGDREQRQRARRALLTECPEPMTIDEHLVQPEELVAYLEDGGAPGEWWLDCWNRLMDTSGVSRAQGALLTKRLEERSLAGGSGATAAHSALQSLGTARPFDALQLRLLISAHLVRGATDLPQLEPELEILLVSGDTPQRELWVAAVDPEPIVTAVSRRLDPAARLRLTREGDPGDPSQATAPALGRQDLFIVAALPGAVARQLTWRYRAIVGGLLAAAIGLIAVLLIAERRRQSELIRIDRLRTEFVGRISHQFRSPLTSIQLYAETLQEGRVPPQKQQEYFETIAGEARSLGELTSRLLNLSRIQQGQYVFRFEQFDLGELLRRQVRGIERQSRHRVAEVRTAIPEDLPTLRGDRESLAEVFVNLLENAAKYTEEDGVLAVAARVEGDTVVVTVDDDGPGIPLTERPRVFQAYYRVDDSLTQKVAGTGLGLTLVRRIVEAHGGRVEIDDSPLGGVRVAVTLPRNGE